jgi:DNA adenine methylase
MGADLYLSTYGPDDHLLIAETMRDCKHRYWAVTYDDVPPIRRMYATCKVLPFRLRYTAQRRRHGAELFIVPKNVVVPASLLRSLRK